MRTLVFSLLTILALLAFAYISVQIQSTSSGFVFTSLLITGLAGIQLSQRKQQTQSAHSDLEKNRV